MAKKTAYLTSEQLAELKRGSDLRSMAELAWTWAWIVACWALYCAYPSVLTFAIGWLIISGRHLGLAILMHDAAHKLLLSNKDWNDRVGQWLTAYPILVNVHAYRAVHLQHHKATWTKADPDLGLAKPFPITKGSFLRKMLRDLSGITGYQRYRFYARLSAGLSPNGKGLEGRSVWRVVRSFASGQRGFLITNGVMLAGLTLAGHPEAYLLLWLVPAFTGYSVVLRIRAIAEHSMVDDTEDELKHTRTTKASWLTRFLIAPHHVNYHLEHHLFMFVPHYKLPKAHRMLREAGVLERAEVAPSYWSVLRKATSASA